MKKNITIASLLFLLVSHLPSFAGYQYHSAKFFQVTGTARAGGFNKQILWGRIRGEASVSGGNWGVSGLSFVMANSNNADVVKAKIWYSTVNEFSTAIVKDSVSIIGDTIHFTFNDLDNLTNTWVYFFLTYDISSSACDGNILDALVPENGITSIGNGAGQKSAIYADPLGYRSISSVPLIPSVSLSTNTSSACAGFPIVFIPSPINGGNNPVYEWFVNDVSVATTIGSNFGGAAGGNFVTNSLTDQARVYCKMTSDLPCPFPLVVVSPTVTITVRDVINNGVIISGPTTLHEGATATYTATSSLTAPVTSPVFQWYRNNVAIVGATQNTLFTDGNIFGDVITCNVTSNELCVIPETAISNALTISTIKKGRSVAIMDMTEINNETTGSNLFSAKHILDVAGISYVVVNKWEDIQAYSFVLCTAWLDNRGTTSQENTIINNYVKNGGVIVIPRLKNDSLKNVFGVSSYSNSTSHFRLNWNMNSNDSSLRWLDDSLEQTISLGRSSEFSSIFDTRSYSLSTATPLAFYEDGTAAVTKNQYGNGYAYSLGASFKDLILRPQLNLDYKAQRTFSNDFEPSSDVFILWIKALYAQHLPNAVWKHTSVKNSKATIMMTHDIDATTACLFMSKFADYEDSLNISASYFITTHYVRDFFAKDFWTPYTSQRQYLLAKNQNIASHSVGHSPDMDNESVIAVGTVGNTVENYLPQYNGVTTIGSSIYGEVEVSKKLLDEDLGVNVISYRPGFLYQHNQQINAMEDLGYKYSSSMSANDVLTSFPYLTHKDMTYEGAVTDIYEIPMNISDAQVSNKLDSVNYSEHVDQWLYCVDKNMANGAPINILIHPTKNYKLKAQRSFIDQLPDGLTFRNVDEFGDYWKIRDNVSFTSTIDDANNLAIVISNSDLPLHKDFSMVVDNGQTLASINIVDEDGNNVNMVQETWTDNGIVLYCQDEISYRKAFVSGSKDAKSAITNSQIYTHCYPNPFNNETNMVYLLNTNANVTLDVFNVFGIKVKTLVNTSENEGLHQIRFDASDLPTGIYYYQLTINGESRTEKMILKK